MLTVTNKNGRAIELQLFGIFGDDIEISEAYYLDNLDEEVIENDIQYVYDNYSDEMYEEWLESNITMSDAYYDLMKEEGN